jgi:VanZ family protein
MTFIRARIILYWMPAASWAALIFMLSTLHGSDRPPPWILSNDKIVHGVLFGILSLGVYFAIRHGHGRARWIAALTGLLVASCYGATDEIHQLWTPHRSSDVMDWVADTVGGACVFLLTLLPSRHEPKC